MDLDFKPQIWILWAKKFLMAELAVTTNPLAGTIFVMSVHVYKFQLPHQQQLQAHVDHLNGSMTTFVMMKIIILDAILMVEIAVLTNLLVGTIFAMSVHVFKMPKDNFYNQCQCIMFI